MASPNCRPKSGIGGFSFWIEIGAFKTPSFKATSRNRRTTNHSFSSCVRLSPPVLGPTFEPKGPKAAHNPMRSGTLTLSFIWQSLSLGRGGAHLVHYHAPPPCMSYKGFAYAWFDLGPVPKVILRVNPMA